MNKYLFFAVLLFIFAADSATFAAGKQEVQPENSSIPIAVSILPQKYFIDRIGGNEVKIIVLLPPGESPETYEPTTKQVTELSKARILFTIGVPFEKMFIPKIRANLKGLNIVDTSADITKRTFSNGSTDPHIWMSPPLVKIQAQTMLKTLISIYPGRKDFFTKNYVRFMKDLDVLDGELSKALAPLKGNIFFVYHPAFGYFADRYGMKQVAIETGGKDPGPKALSAVISRVKKAGARAIFVQPEFQQSSAHVIAKVTGAAVVAIDPLAENYLANLRSIAQAVTGSLQ